MSKFTEIIGGLITATVVGTGSALATGCDIVSSTACESGKVISQIAEGVAKSIEDKRENNFLDKK